MPALTLTLDLPLLCLGARTTTAAEPGTQEERIFIAAHKTLGNRWSEIAKFLPGRDARSVTNHWYNAIKLAKGKTSLLQQYRVSLNEVVKEVMERRRALSLAGDSMNATMIQGPAIPSTATMSNSAAPEVGGIPSVLGASLQTPAPTGTIIMGLAQGNADPSSSALKEVVKYVPIDRSIGGKHASGDAGRLRMPWSILEDETFIKAHKELGNNWTQIAARLPGRNYHSVYYHWKYSMTRSTDSVLRAYCLSLKKDGAAAAEAKPPAASAADAVATNDKKTVCQIREPGAAVPNGNLNAVAKPDAPAARVEAPIAAAENDEPGAAVAAKESPGAGAGAAAVSVPTAVAKLEATAVDEKPRGVAASRDNTFGAD